MCGFIVSWQDIAEAVRGPIALGLLISGGKEMGECISWTNASILLHVSTVG